MSLRTGHGAGAGSPRVETLPVDELPMGMPGPALNEQPGERTAAGRFAPGSRSVQVAGGRARAGATRLARRLTIAEGSSDVLFKPYRKAAAAFRRAQIAHLARTVGGGYVGPGPASMVASAALQLALSRFITDRAEQVQASDLALASRLANESRQNLAMAHELVAKEAKARPQESGLAKLRREARARDVEGTPAP